MEASKITFSDAERRLITDVNVILTKNRAMEKIGLGFSNLAVRYQQVSKPLVDEFPHIFGILPKISKGEKHNGFPWMMLDFPRCFDNHRGHLAIRSFFWWGHYYSIHLQVSKTFLPAVGRHLPEWKRNNTDWLTGLTEDAWDLYLPNPTWKNPDAMPIEALADNGVLKIAKKIPIEDWAILEESFSEAFAALISLIRNSFRHRAGETIP